MLLGDWAVLVVSLCPPDKRHQEHTYSKTSWFQFLLQWNRKLTMGHCGVSVSEGFRKSLLQDLGFCFVIWACSREEGVHSRWGQKAGAILQGEQTRVRIKLQPEKQQQSLNQLGEGSVQHFVGGTGTLFLSVLGQHHKMVLFHLILSWSQHNLAYWCSAKLLMF